MPMIKQAGNIFFDRLEHKPALAAHYLLGTTLCAPFPAHLQAALFGMGCFWGAEKCFWECAGVYSTAVGYTGGHTPHPRYEDVCSGETGHNEVVLVVFDPVLVTYPELLIRFWQNHNPTLGMRQGNDVGTQYRSGIYYFDELQCEQAQETRLIYQAALNRARLGEITTEIKDVAVFYYAEPYHQQYLAKNLRGYCPDISCGATGLPVFDGLLGNVILGN